jgi:Resolvase, N terminal domain
MLLFSFSSCTATFPLIFVAALKRPSPASRLARNNADWHRLLEICALTETLILDEDGVYDPASFNDRLLLGLKGAMSEAEPTHPQSQAARWNPQ